jgi:hypothetical protein
MLEQLWLARAWFVYGAIAILVVLSFWKGGGPERAVVSTFAGMIATDNAYHAILGSGTYLSVDSVHLAIDVLGLAALYVIALYANRVYTLWIAAAQIIAVLSHFYRGIMPHVDQLAYAIMIRLPSYVMTLALVLGLVFHLIRTRRVGSYPSWRNSLRRSPRAASNARQSG